MFWLAAIYATLVVYGTLFPLNEWTPPLWGWINPITAAWPQSPSRADLLVNLLAYVPLGLFMALALRPRTGAVMAIVITVSLGTALSFALETLQSALPSRVPSPLDWATNTAGTAMGALVAAIFAPHFAVGRTFHQWRQAWFTSGTLSNLALIIVLLWALTQTAPFVPSLDWGNLKSGLRPLGNTLRHLSSFDAVRALESALQILALGLLIRCIERRALLWPFLAFALAVLLYKVPVVGRNLTLEALAGWLGAALLLAVVPARPPAARTLFAAAALLTAHALAQFEPGKDATLSVINWVPFRGQVGTVGGMLDILETLWPFMALGLLARWSSVWRWRRVIMSAGGALVISLTFALEWMQQAIPGRFADVTDVILAGVGWLLPWMVVDTRGRTSAAPSLPPPHTIRGLLAAAIVSVSGAGGMAESQARIAADGRARTMLPAPESLAEITLPGFRYTHPRLPHPTEADILRLRRENPDWIERTRRTAGGGEGRLEAVIVMAYIEPGSQDLALLHRRLVAIQYSHRGTDAKPVAQAYDWLYEQWTPAQRAALREKLAEGVGYLVGFIRKDRLSPYNVYLYNSPLQALLASSLALYGDDPRGERYMRFTHELWQHRVLPAWRQIMGTNGGWHEGGEYVGIGIGQAIYQAPAMWRSATGEDLFKTEPGLRGFLDFVTYRRRPDETDFRWGDAGFFDKVVPDVVALALEYRHAAAYNLRPPRPRPEPSSWPWGPLTDASLLDPDARSRLPLARHFDGIGMVVARSAWSRDATYLTFKAGDNFWSHSHLDQGAFTLYKGGGLALDSGFYGPKYGSDHHMNYMYQSIAHNLVTVTDPDDTAPASGKEIRAIANDGGQRRIGSGWGVESAPIDLNEWLDKREIYHTGVMQRYFEGHDAVVGIADLTPAYTNAESGPGEFSHRTRRVERMWRTLVYDRLADVVIVRDIVHATHPEFRKRWLLHTQHEPSVGSNRFSVRVPPDPARQARGGSLVGLILAPARPDLQKIGGAGFEFWVDGKNYDEAGSLHQAITRKGQPTEAGSWRIELSPPTPQREDEFLVVLIPRLAGDETTPVIRHLTGDQASGVEINAGGAIRRWWFETAGQGVRLELDGQTVHIDSAAMAGSPAASTWLQKIRAWWQAP